MTNTELAVGVDLGGTKIAAGVFDARGARRGELAVEPACADRPASATRDRLFAAIERALASASVGVESVLGIGIGSPGPLDPRAGKVLATPNLPQLDGFPICAQVSERFGAPVELSNDGNCFALAEARVGAGEGHGVVLGITMGTGCGVGIVINGQILEGPNASAGEVFLARVGDRTYDDALSGTGLERLWRERTGEQLAGVEVTRRAEASDAIALEVFERFADQAALGLGNFVALLDPGVVVIGGSVATAFHLFGARLRASLRQYVARPACEHVEIVPTRLGRGAGAIGAAFLLFSGGRLA